MKIGLFSIINGRFQTSLMINTFVRIRSVAAGTNAKNIFNDFRGTKIKPEIYSLVGSSVL